MSPSDTPLSETDIRSPNSVMITIRADPSEQRQWALAAPICPALKLHQIAHLGVGRMPSPFEIVRHRLGGSYFLASLSGEGRVLVDGRWKICGENQAFVLPPGVRHAFHTAPGKTWSFCWVRYEERRTPPPPGGFSSPVLAEFNSKLIEHAILGLHHECQGEASPAAIDQWVRLVQYYVEQFHGSHRIDSRLKQLWSEIQGNLGFEWTSDEMAQRMGLSEKQLERLCRRDLGRTPRQQLIWLRMRRAADLLIDGRETVEAIANDVGYQNPFVFSRTFKRCMGWPPTEYASKYHSD